jgi:hypothetical protein
MYKTASQIADQVLEKLAISDNFITGAMDRKMNQLIADKGVSGAMLEGAKLEGKFPRINQRVSPIYEGRLANLQAQAAKVFKGNIADQVSANPKAQEKIIKMLFKSTPPSSAAFADILGVPAAAAKAPAAATAPAAAAAAASGAAPAASAAAKNVAKKGMGALGRAGLIGGGLGLGALGAYGLYNAFKDDE